jgi:hypothetical protein
VCVTYSATITSWKYITKAARHGHAALVAFLHSTAGQSLYESVSSVDCGLEAARSGSVAVLAYVQAHATQQFSTQHALKTMLHCCMRMNHLDAAKWLREQGAPWPDKLWFYHNGDAHDDGSCEDDIQTCGLEMLRLAVRHVQRAESVWLHSRSRLDAC